MPVETGSMLNANLSSPKVARGKVITQRQGKLGRAVRIPNSILRQAGLRVGSGVNVELQGDGSIVIRRLGDLQAINAEDAKFERCAATLLEKRKELLERLSR